jgi:hypothetical protein
MVRVVFSRFCLVTLVRARHVLARGSATPPILSSFLQQLELYHTTIVSIFESRLLGRRQETASNARFRHVWVATVVLRAAQHILSVQCNRVLQTYILIGVTFIVVCASPVAGAHVELSSECCVRNTLVGSRAPARQRRHVYGRGVVTSDIKRRAAVARRGRVAAGRRVAPPRAAVSTQVDAP